MSKAIISGITGQDGAYLAKYLLDLGYDVIGLSRPGSDRTLYGLRYLDILSNKRFRLIQSDITDLSSMIDLVSSETPQEFYNLAAQSHVGHSFKQPILTANVSGLAVMNILEALKIVNRDIKFYQASTSELFGKVQQNIQSETTPFFPRSPYAVAKLFAHHATINYRESYGIYAVAGILFNHESHLRGSDFVTKKISSYVAKRKLGLVTKPIELGNLDSMRDWGFAGDYVIGMHKMLTKDNPTDYVLATGVTTPVREFLRMCFAVIDVKIEFEGTGLAEKCRCSRTGEILAQVSPSFFRPAEVDFLKGDPRSAFEDLDWEAKVDVETLAEIMTTEDIKYFS